MARLIMQYSILISCPSDVEEELDIIKQVIEDFNKTIGDANNASLAVKHWSTHSYPESGGKPQELLNEQIVLDCDAAIAVFQTRFGTPTDEYGSGTEEEIELLLKENKQVFLYFSNKPIPPSDMVPEQYDKVTSFKNKYKDKGIYSEYNGLEEFKQLLTNHLNFHFLKIISEKDSLLTHKKTPSLNIKGIGRDDITEKAQIIQSKLQKSQFIKDIELEISDLFRAIKSIDIPTEVEEKKEETTEGKKELEVSDSLKEIGRISLKLNEISNPLQKFFKKREVYFTEKDKGLVKEYANSKSITVDETLFFNMNQFHNAFLKKCSQEQNSLKLFLKELYSSFLSSL